MMPTPPQPTPAPIHDIADGILIRLISPAWLPFWMAAALALLALIGLLFWLTRRKRPSPPPTPRQSALAALEQLRREGPEADPYSFGVKISDALRAYIRDQHRLDAVTRTSVEFLEALRENRAFTINEKEALSEFLESVDLLKYARLSAAAEDIQSLLAIAERLVRGQNAMPASAAK